VQQTTPQPLPSKSFSIHFSLVQSSSLLLIPASTSFLASGPVRTHDYIFFAPTPNMCFEMVYHPLWPITVAARSKAWTVFARSNAGIVTSNPTQGIDICIVRVYYVFVLFCV
jgi:hypothetical protein